MCGIAGFSLTPDSPIDSLSLAISLLDGIEDRGRMATGAAWFDAKKGQVYQLKQPRIASQFSLDLISSMPENTGLCILHTRHATKGTVENPANNHPINLPGIVGVHNGMLDNDDQVMRKFNFDRVGEVDSEAIFHVLKAFGVKRVASEIEGDAAIAWLEWTGPAPIEEPNLKLATLSNRPIVIAQTERGDTIFASTRAAIYQAERECKDFRITFMEAVADGQFIEVDQGKIIKSEECGTMLDRWRGQAWKSAANGVSTPKRQVFSQGKWIDKPTPRSTPIFEPKAKSGEPRSQRYGHNKNVPDEYWEDTWEMFRHNNGRWMLQLVDPIEDWDDQDWEWAFRSGYSPNREVTRYDPRANEYVTEEIAMERCLQYEEDDLEDRWRQQHDEGKVNGWPRLDEPSRSTVITPTAGEYEDTYEGWEQVAPGVWEHPMGGLVDLHEGTEGVWSAYESN